MCFETEDTMQTKKPDCVIRGTGTPSQSTTSTDEQISGTDLVSAMSKLGLTVKKLSELSKLSSRTIARARKPKSNVCSESLMRITQVLKNYQKIEADEDTNEDQGFLESLKKLGGRTITEKEEGSAKPNLIPDLTEPEKYAVVKALFERRKENGFSKKDVKKVEEWATKAKFLKIMFDAVIDGQAVIDIVNDEVAIIS
jgi:transcriptional regulator with XRE-family HTH domain